MRPDHPDSRRGTARRGPTHPTGGGPLATYSIVARDSLSGQLGVAVQSHWFSVGPIVPWARPGVGAVATQSLVDPAYGPLGLEADGHGQDRSGGAHPPCSPGMPRLRCGKWPWSMPRGTSPFTRGARAIAAAGHQAGAQYSVQGNLMDRDSSVAGHGARPTKMPRGDLAERLLAALEVAEAEGGDLRGRQSAAILVVSAEDTGRPWVDRVFDLRVEDHPEPVEGTAPPGASGARLPQAQRGGRTGDRRGTWRQPWMLTRAATEVVPDEATGGEAPFWVGVTLASEGREEEAVPYLQRAQAQNDRWGRPAAAFAGLWSDAGGR